MKRKKTASISEKHFQCSGFCRKWGLVSLFLMMIYSLHAQSGGLVLTLNQAIALAKERSAQAQMARYGFMGQYWNYRSYRAELLPSFNLIGNLGNYDRSIVEARDANTGTISYLENNTLSNDLNLSVNQNIPFTGGQVSLNSYVSRLDQYRYDKKTYNTNPFTLNYIQPLRSYNVLKWKKKTAPLQYENAKKRYLETMEQITIQATSLFFSVLSAQSNYQKSQENYADRQRLYDMAQERTKLGTTNRSEMLQLQLSLLNAEISVNTTKLASEMQLFNLCSYLGIKDISGIELITPKNIPDIELNYNLVLDKAYKNSTHVANQSLKLLESQRALAQAKSVKGLQADFRVNLGFSQAAETFADAYHRLRDREVVGVTLRMPIYDWGLGKGKVKMAEADLDITEKEIEIVEIEFKQDIWAKTVQFNNQLRQCEISQIAQSIAMERYEITKKRFQNGTVTVTELNTAQKEFDDAQTQYISQLRTYWMAYYELQKLSLYDYIHKNDISAEFDKIIR